MRTTWPSQNSWLERPCCGCKDPMSCKFQTGLDLNKEVNRNA